MKKLMTISVIATAMLVLAGCSSKNDTKKVDDDKKEVKSTKVSSSKEIQSSKTSSSSSMKPSSSSVPKSTTSSSSSAPKKEEPKQEIYTAKNLTVSQKKEIDKQMIAFCESRAKMGNMAYFGTMAPTSGAHGDNEKYFIRTNDGEVVFWNNLKENENNRDLWIYPESGNLNSVSSGIFFTRNDGATGRQEMMGICAADSFGSVAQDKPITYYMFADNGKVYEYQTTVDEMKEDGNRVYAASWPGQEPNDSVIFKQSEDKAVTDKYQSLLKEYSGEKQEQSNFNQSELTSFMQEYAAKNGFTAELADMKNDNYGPMIVTAGMTYFSDKNQMPQICMVSPLTLNGQDFTFNFDNDKGQNKIIAAYGPKADKWTENPHRFLFVRCDGKNYVYEAKEEGKLEEIKSGELVDKFNELSK